jgi:hypothetical protein
MSSLVQMPVRSGAPHAVRGAFQFGSFTLAAVVSAGTDRSFDGVFGGPNWADTILGPATMRAKPISDVIPILLRCIVRSSLQRLYPDR